MNITDAVLYFYHSGQPVKVELRAAHMHLMWAVDNIIYIDMEQPYLENKTHSHSQTDRYTDRWADRQTSRKKWRPTYRKAGRQIYTDRQADKAGSQT